MIITIIPIILISLSDSKTPHFINKQTDMYSFCPRNYLAASCPFASYRASNSGLKTVTSRLEQICGQISRAPREHRAISFSRKCFLRHNIGSSMTNASHATDAQMYTYGIYAWPDRVAAAKDVKLKGNTSDCNKQGNCANRVA